VYAVAGRESGTNFDFFQAYDPAQRRWIDLPKVPDPRGGTPAAAIAGQIVSVGGEAPEGTEETVYAYTVRTRRWRRLPDLPTPRHGLGVVSLAGRVYAVAGGPQPGLFVSSANEYLPVS
jgi:non-specific serine/threonine protein kinase